MNKFDLRAEADDIVKNASDIESSVIEACRKKGTANEIKSLVQQVNVQQNYRIFKDTGFKISKAAKLLKPLDYKVILRKVKNSKASQYVPQDRFPRKFSELKKKIHRVVVPNTIERGAPDLAHTVSIITKRAKLGDEDARLKVLDMRDKIPRVIDESRAKLATVRNAIESVATHCPALFTELRPVLSKRASLMGNKKYTAKTHVQIEELKNRLKNASIELEALYKIKEEVSDGWR